MSGKRIGSVRTSYATTSINSTTDRGETPTADRHLPDEMVVACAVTKGVLKETEKPARVWLYIQNALAVCRKMLEE